jgi:hypothetical protein
MLCLLQAVEVLVAVPRVVGTSMKTFLMSTLSVAGVFIDFTYLDGTMPLLLFLDHCY